jgi:hypothetical protein
MECPICLEDIDEENLNFITFSCGHIICNDCFSLYIIKSIKEKKKEITCPICRGNILLIIDNSLLKWKILLFLFMFLFLLMIFYIL